MARITRQQYQKQQEAERAEARKIFNPVDSRGQAVPTDGPCPCGSGERTVGREISDTSGERRVELVRRCKGCGREIAGVVLSKF